MAEGGLEFSAGEGESECRFNGGEEAASIAMDGERGAGEKEGRYGRRDERDDQRGDRLGKG